MSFRSSAYSVVARIFKLIDSNGFTRLFFGPFVYQANSGFALRYEEPNWTDPDIEAGLWFGASGSPNTAMADLYVIGPGGSTIDLAGVSVTLFDTGATKSLGSTIFADDDSGGVGREASVSTLAQSLPLNQTDILINALNGARFAQIEVKADGTRSEILIVADRMGPWTAFPFNAGVWQDFGGGVQVCQYRRIGDMVQVRGLAKNTIVTGAPSLIGTLPVGFRGAGGQELFLAFDQPAGFARLDVNGTGDIVLQAAHGVIGQATALELQFYTSA